MSKRGTGQPYELGPDFSDGLEGADRSLLAHCLTLVDKEGWAVEFGVGSGESTRMIASVLPVIGFDSFQGLPEDWRPGFPAGRFSEYEEPRDIAACTIVPGWFEDTLPDYDWPTWISLIHFDADLYSSTKTALDSVGAFISEDCILVFDEFFGYQDDEAGGDALRTGEARAWHEFAEIHDISWRVIGHGREQWAIQITEAWV